MANAKLAWAEPEDASANVELDPAAARLHTLELRWYSQFEVVGKTDIAKVEHVGF